MNQQDPRLSLTVLEPTHETSQFGRSVVMDETVLVLARWLQRRMQ